MIQRGQCPLSSCPRVLAFACMISHGNDRTTAWTWYVALWSHLPGLPRVVPTINNTACFGRAAKTPLHSHRRFRVLTPCKWTRSGLRLGSCELCGSAHATGFGPACLQSQRSFRVTYSPDVMTRVQGRSRVADRIWDLWLQQLYCPVLPAKVTTRTHLHSRHDFCAPCTLLSLPRHSLSCTSCHCLS